MRILALDYGSKAIGLAICDELRLTVRPFSTIRRRRQSRNEIIAQIQAIITTNEIAELVVGLPLNMDGTIGDAALRTIAFIDELKKKLAIPVRTQDERLSSQAAESILRAEGYDRQARKAKSDEYAATIILQDYLLSQPQA